MFEPKKNSVKKSSQIVEPPVQPETGGWKQGGKKNNLDVKRPGFEK